MSQLSNKGKAKNQDLLGSARSKTLTRRRFLARIGIGATLLSMGGFVQSIASFMAPKLNFEPQQTFTIGRPEDFIVGDMKLLEGQQIYIFRNEVGLQAVSAICTHLGCTYQPYGPPSGQYDIVHAYCPCHGSRFARDGRVIGGPAPRPVPFFSMSLTPDGRIVVDKGINSLTDELSKKSGEGVGHNLYFDPVKGRMVEGPLPDGRDCLPCMGVRKD